MKLLKLTLITMVIGAMSFLFIKGQKRPNEVTPKNPSQSLKTQYKDRWGEAVFNEAAYQAVKGGSIESVCGNKDQHTQYFCWEGHFYITYIKKLNELSVKFSNTELSHQIKFDSVMQGLALGMAITTRGLSPIVFDKNKFHAFIEDGWGFAKTLKDLGRAVLNISEICDKLDEVKYCQFGQGRALFIDNRDFSLAESISDYAKLGYLFAEVAVTKNKNMSDESIQKVALDLKSNSSNGKYKRCVIDEKNHFLDCAEAGARL